MTLPSLMKKSTAPTSASSSNSYLFSQHFQRLLICSRLQDSLVNQTRQQSEQFNQKLDEYSSQGNPDDPSVSTYIREYISNYEDLMRYAYVQVFFHALLIVSRFVQSQASSCFERCLSERAHSCGGSSFYRLRVQVQFQGREISRCPLNREKEMAKNTVLFARSAGGAINSHSFNYKQHRKDRKIATAQLKRWN